ncbi:MAG: hypothetical protein CVT70_00750 [Alphaproteobacteria bacterium HGW-Alphaproteobacteria-1]|nr:MAG: hypothetical protein CVT70_00750 [Alphaproteobacteria bacterium HGW-Alphaproteobacteria-1]
MSDDRREDVRLEAFFEAARATPPEPSPALMAAVLRAAEGLQPAAPRAPLTARLREAFGGWPALAGLATAAAAGVWIGTALPEAGIGAAEAAYLVDVAPELAFDLAGDF